MFRRALLGGAGAMAATAAYGFPHGHVTNNVVAPPANSISITSIPSFADTSSTIAVGGAYVGPAPGGFSPGVWSAGTGGGTVTSFVASGGTNGTWTANVSVPTTVVSATLTLTGTGANTSSATSSSVSIVTPGSAVLVQSFSLTNWNASGTSPGFMRIGMPFKKGDIPSTASVQIKRGSTIIDAQFDERTTWTDGSVKFAVCHLRDTTFTASEARNYDAWRVPTSSFNNTGSKTLADITGAHDFKVNFTNLGETDQSGYPGYISGTTLYYGSTGGPPPSLNPGDNVVAPTGQVSPGTVIVAATVDNGQGDYGWTINNSQTLGSYTFRNDITAGPGTLVPPVGSGSFTAHFNSHAGVATRVTKIHSGAVCEGWQIWGMATDNTGGAEDRDLKTNWYVDIWKNSDGSIASIEIAPVVAMDWFESVNSTGRRRCYDAALVDGSTPIVSYLHVDHIQRTQWIMCVNDGSHNRGRRPWTGGAIPTLTYTFDKVYWITSKMIPPYDTTVSYVNGYSDPLTSGAYNLTYTPGRCFNQRVSIDGQGGYLGRGLMPDNDGFALMLQRPQDYAASRINALAGLHIFYHFRTKTLRTRPGESADLGNTPISFIMSSTGTTGMPPYDFTADGMPAPVVAASVTTYTYTPPGGEGCGFNYHASAGASHAVNFNSMIYILEGERYHLESQIDLATNLVHAFSSYVDNTPLDGAGWSPTQVYGSIPTGITYNGTAGIPGEERANGFAINLIGYAAALSPDNHVAKNFMKRFLIQQAAWFRDSYDHYPADVKASGFMLGLDNDHTAGWQSAICGQCFVNAYRMTEIDDLKVWGFFKAKLSVNCVNTATPLTDSPYLIGTHCRNYTQVIGTAGGYTTSPIMWDGYLFTNDWNTTTNRIRSAFPFIWGEGAIYPTRGYWPQNGDVIYSQDGNLRGGDVARPEMALNTPYYIVNVVDHGTYSDFQISASLGGAPIVFGGASGTYTFMGCPQEMIAVTDMGGTGTDIRGSWNYGDYPGFHMGLLTLAFMEGCPEVTPTVLAKQAVYVGQSTNPGWANDIFSCLKVPP